MNNTSEPVDFGLDKLRPIDGLILAFDFGMKRIGVAVGQMLTQTAQPLTVLIAKDGVPDWDQFDELHKEWLPAAIVVGIPLHMDGSESEITLCAKKFARKIKVRTRLPVFGIDERLTSREAEKLIAECETSRRSKRPAVDSLAAKLILDNYLNFKFEE